MAFCDFVVKFDPSKDSSMDLTKRILYSIFIKRIKNKKPVRIFIGGGSGEGKSFASLRLQELLMEIQGIDLKKYVNDINVYVPLEYPEKLDKLLNESRLKKINIVCIHEARDVIKAKLWYSFVNTAVSDINAMSRSVKRLITIIISQFIRDISSDMRYTLDFYVKASRPSGKKTRLYISVMWKDDRDLEKPKLRKRKLSGYIVNPDGKYKRFIPTYLVMNKPDKEIVAEFEKQDYESKKKILNKKINELMNEMRKETGIGSNKVESMVDYYSENTKNLSKIGRRNKNGWSLKPEFRKMHDLSKDEAKDFATKLNEKLKEKGIVGDE